MVPNPANGPTGSTSRIEKHPKKYTRIKLCTDHRIFIIAFLSYTIGFLV